MARHHIAADIGENESFEHFGLPPSFQHSSLSGLLTCICHCRLSSHVGIVGCKQSFQRAKMTLERSRIFALAGLAQRNELAGYGNAPGKRLSLFIKSRDVS